VAALGDLGVHPAIGQQAVMADADKPRRQQMQQGAAQKLRDFERQGFLDSAVTIIALFPTESAV
jgi:hypothetical protein